MARRGKANFHVFGFDEPVPAPGAAARNGAYTGPAAVRVIPPGVFGSDLAMASRVEVAVGQEWRRGPQLVRVIRATSVSVWFRELTHGAALRRLPRWQFVAGGYPVRTCPRRERGRA